MATPYFSVTFSGDDARKLAKLLYTGSSVHLVRKYDKASAFFKKDY